MESHPPPPPYVATEEPAPEWTPEGWRATAGAWLTVPEPVVDRVKERLGLAGLPLARHEIETHGDKRVIWGVETDSLPAAVVAKDGTVCIELVVWWLVFEQGIKLDFFQLRKQNTVHTRRRTTIHTYHSSNVAYEITIPIRFDHEFGYACKFRCWALFAEPAAAQPAARAAVPVYRG